MQDILFGYKLNPTTWAYISSLMMIGVYFKFQRFWSVRNLDLAGLICFTPGLLLVYYGLLKQLPDLVRAGYVWLFVVGGFFLVRLLLDATMVRRPLLEPNLSAGGLAFTGAALLVFLMANVITATNPASTSQERLEDLLPKAAVLQERLPAAEKGAESKEKGLSWSSPGYGLFYQFSRFSKDMLLSSDQSQPEAYRQTLIHTAATRAAVILAHLAVVAGLVWIGYRHFDNIHTGVAAATLYLLSFYTSQLTGQVDHIVPAMLLVWALAAYRRPMLAGLLLGLAGGMIYYPLFLLPLWCGFYWRRGEVRFLFGVVVALGILVGCLALASPDLTSFVGYVQQMFGWRNPSRIVPTGFWQYYESAFRIPVLAGFVVLSLSLAIWPAQKNFGTLMSCSAAVMLAAQFWHANLGGLYMAWYLPLLILTVFRPNLEDRIAFSAVRALWLPWRRKTG